jgi:hypothetical protein
MSDSQPEIRKNYFKNNISGIDISGSGVPVLGSATNYGLNIFKNNSEFAIVNNSQNTIIAIGNYWDTIDPDAIDNKIYDDDENSNSGPVIFEPFMDEVPDPDDDYENDWPTITSVEPNLVTGSNSDQLITVHGTGFEVGAFVILDDIDGDLGPLENPEKTTFVSSTELTKQATFTESTATWSARVENPDGSRSDTVHFEVEAPANQSPVVAIADGPDDGSTIGFNNPEFTWGGNDPDGTVVGYEVELNGPSPDVFSTEGEVHQFENLENDEHTFRVRAEDNEGAFSEWAERSFTVDDQEEKLVAPTQVSPSDEEMDVSLTPTIEWESVDGADYYILHVNGLNPSERVIEEEVSETSFIPSEPLVSNRLHQWRVRAVAGEAEGEWSPDWEFTTQQGLAFTGEMSDQTLRAGDNYTQEPGLFEFDGVDNLFIGGSAPFTYSASSSNDNFVQAEISDNKLIVQPTGADINGEAVTVTISATDQYDHSASGSFDVITHPAFGDLNADGRVNSFDASQILQYSVELIDFNDIQQEVADLNQDGRINSFDASLVLRYSVELIDVLPLTSSSTTAIVSSSATTSQMSENSQPGEFAWGEVEKSETLFSVPIVLTETGSLYSVDFKGSFDSSLGTVRGITYEELPDGWIAHDRIDEKEGRVFIALAGSTPYEGEKLASIEFDLTDSFGSMQLSGSGFANSSGFTMEELQVNEVPEESALHNNYPNPFNPTTTVDYQLPADADIRIELFNIAGQRIMTLLDDNQSAGIYSLSVDLSAFSSGVYLIRMVAQSESDSFSKVNKMTLIK